MIGKLFAGLRRLEEAPASSHPARRAEPEGVLIINDSAEDLRALSLALANQQYRLETANNAVLAKWKLSGASYGLILLNPRMLDTDGNRFARRLLTDENLAAVPIAALAENATEPRGRNGMFDGMVGRPFDAPGLPGQVRAVLTAAAAFPRQEEREVPMASQVHQDRRQDGLRLLDAIEAGLPDSQFSPDTPPALRQLMTGVRGLQQFELADYVRRAAQLSAANTVRARSRFRLLIRLCRDLLLLGPDSIPELANLRTGYLENRSVDLDRLEFALKGGDFGTLDKIGHNLKGTGAAYGFGELTELGRSLEAAARSEDIGAAENLLDQMEAYISIARPFA